MNELLLIVLSTLLVSLLSLIGIVTLILNERRIGRILLVLVSLSAGTLMGGAFLHLLPEAVEESKNLFSPFAYFLVGFAVFFLIEKILRWRHCHTEHCPVHSFAYMNLVGDSVHNFIDGAIIAASYIVDFRLGIVTTFVVALHELPQEIGDFGVLVYGGFSKKKALLLNFVTAATAVFGGIVGYFFSVLSEYSVSFLVPVAAGGFVYIAASDLIPEIKKETRIALAMINFSVFVAGILVMYVLSLF